MKAMVHQRMTSPTGASGSFPHIDVSSRDHRSSRMSSTSHASSTKTRHERSSASLTVGTSGIQRLVWIFSYIALFIVLISSSCAHGLSIIPPAQIGTSSSNNSNSNSSISRIDSNKNSSNSNSSSIVGSSNVKFNLSSFQRLNCKGSNMSNRQCNTSRHDALSSSSKSSSLSTSSSSLPSSVSSLPSSSSLSSSILSSLPLSPTLSLSSSSLSSSPSSSSLPRRSPTSSMKSAIPRPRRGHSFLPPPPPYPPHFPSRLPSRFMDDRLVNDDSILNEIEEEEDDDDHNHNHDEQTDVIDATSSSNEHTAAKISSSSSNPTFSKETGRHRLNPRRHLILSLHSLTFKRGSKSKKPYRHRHSSAAKPGVGTTSYFRQVDHDSQKGFNSWNVTSHSQKVYTSLKKDPDDVRRSKSSRHPKDHRIMLQEEDHNHQGHEGHDHREEDRWGQRNHLEFQRPSPRVPIFQQAVLQVAPGASVRRARAVDTGDTDKPPALSPPSTSSSSSSSSSRSKLDTAKDETQESTVSKLLEQIEKVLANDSMCKGKTVLEELKGFPKFTPALTFAKEVDQIIQVANFINTMYSHANGASIFDLYVLFALPQTVVEFSDAINGCGLVFQNSSHPDIELYPYAYRNSEGSIVTSNLYDEFIPFGTAWFTYHNNRYSSQKRKNSTIETAEIFYTNGSIEDISAYVKRDRAVTVFAKDGFWTNPFYDCLAKRWLVQFSVPFFALNNSVPEFKGVVMLEANLNAAPINQCANDGSLFSDSHRCPRESTQCVNIPAADLRVGSYHCVCKPGYSMPGSNTDNNNNKDNNNSSSSDSGGSSSNRLDYFEGKAVEKAYLDYVRNISSNYSTSFSCIMNTPPGPATLPEEETILAFDFLVRGIPLGIQSFCMTVAVVIGFVILCLRKTKVMRTSIWILLEMLILGAILLYATVVIQYFEPTTTTCLLQPWFREMGFAIVYGVLVLKIYRILAEFQSRKAHRVHVRDKDLLKYLAIILVVVIAYMSAWTAVNMDHLEHNSTILEHLDMPDTGLSYILCRSMLWDYVIEAGELIFLFCGIYMCYCIRSAPTEYSEGKYITIAIVYEALISTLFYILRHLWWYSVHPDHLFLMYFLRCQVSVTVVLFIILGPKLWYAHRPPDDDHARSRAYSQSDVQDSSSPEMMKLNVGISSNGDVEVGEISLTEMDPEDIRAELKRLYTQLQIYKTKTMRKDNPHISKRRGGRKQTHRRFSLQAFHHKHRHHHDHDHEHEMSKTPEESTNSAEAMAFTIDPSVREDPSETGGRPLPSVSFKSGHK